MLGGYCLRKLAGDSGNKVIAPSRDSFNLQSPDLCFKNIVQEKPDVILHLAAETNVDLCEREPARAFLFNCQSTRAVAKAAAEINAKLIYVSTSNVFGDEGRISYNELDIPRPVNYYGKSKLAGENEIKAVLPGAYLIVRAGWMIGGGEGRDHKFVGKIIEQINGPGEVIKAVEDKYGNLTYAKDLANFIDYAIKNSIRGTFHVAAKGRVSRYQIAQYVADLMEFSGAVEAVKSSVYPLSAPRPDFECIDSIAIESLHPGFDMSDWRMALKEYLKEFS